MLALINVGATSCSSWREHARGHARRVPLRVLLRDLGGAMVVGVELEQELDCRGRRRVHVPVHAAHGSGLDVPGTLLVAPPCVERSPRRVPVYPLWKILGLEVGVMGLRRTVSWKAFVH